MAEIRPHLQLDAGLLGLYIVQEAKYDPLQALSAYRRRPRLHGYSCSFPQRPFEEEVPLNYVH